MLRFELLPGFCVGHELVDGQVLDDVRFLEGVRGDATVDSVLEGANEPLSQKIRLGTLARDSLEDDVDGALHVTLRGNLLSGREERTGDRCGLGREGERLG